MTTLDEALRALEQRWRDRAAIVYSARRNDAGDCIGVCANELAALLSSRQEDDTAAENAKAHDRAALAMIGMGYYWDGEAWVKSSRQEVAPVALMAARETEDDGAAIMGRLARALAKADPSSKLPRMAIEWLRSQGIHWKSHCPTDPLHDFGEPVSDNKSINQLRAIRRRFDYSGTFEDAERCAALDVAIDALTSTGQTSDARDGLQREFASLLPGPYYMDPPDGGDVSVMEQFRRMAVDAHRYRWLRNESFDVRGMSPAVILATENLDVDCEECGGFEFGEGLDKAIDAAMQQTTRGGENG